ncbi:Rpn family recombination-promoting nuclease/putative transposase [Skermanella rosea]|uniref:DUF4351 domain-containing protein n=1 Tax=Skermanella rosea TaxID=1817965 RepID=UPI001931386F|nr:DUF4351 domain-containing protein [Skermanella rosea]UEM03126.1 Rpn family recombination-promoting nuclease/putative transposase [Skermanella rosea]
MTDGSDDGGGGRRLIRQHDQFARQLLDQPGVADAFLRERLPAGLVDAGLLDFGYVLVDLGAIADHELSRHPELQAGLLVLKYAGRDADPQETLERLLSVAAGAGLTVIVSVVRYLFGAAEALDRERLKAMLGRVVPKEDEKVASMALREYLDEARAEARAAALVEGRAEAMAEMLLRQLGRRFGPLPEGAVRRVRGASLAELDRLADDIFDAPSLEAMLGDCR